MKYLNNHTCKHHHLMFYMSHTLFSVVSVYVLLVQQSVRKKNMKLN